MTYKNPQKNTTMYSNTFRAIYEELERDHLASNNNKHVSNNVSNNVSNPTDKKPIPNILKFTVDDIVPPAKNVTRNIPITSSVGAIPSSTTSTTSNPNVPIRRGVKTLVNQRSGLTYPFKDSSLSDPNKNAQVESRIPIGATGPTGSTIPAKIPSQPVISTATFYSNKDIPQITPTTEKKLVVNNVMSDKKQAPEATKQLPMSFVNEYTRGYEDLRKASYPVRYDNLEVSPKLYEEEKCAVKQEETKTTVDPISDHSTDNPIYNPTDPQIIQDSFKDKLLVEKLDATESLFVSMEENRDLISGDNQNKPSTLTIIDETPSTSVGPTICVNAARDTVRDSEVEPLESSVKHVENSSLTEIMRVSAIVNPFMKKNTNKNGIEDKFGGISEVKKSDIKNCLDSIDKMQTTKTDLTNKTNNTSDSTLSDQTERSISTKAKEVRENLMNKQAEQAVPEEETLNWEPLDLNDINTSFKVVGDLPPNTKLKIVNNKYLAAEDSYVTSYSRYAHGQGRERIISFLDHLFKETRRNVDLLLEDIYNGVNVDDNLDALRGVMYKLPIFLHRFDVMRSVYKSDTGVYAKLGNIRDNFFSFMGTFYRKVTVGQKKN